MDTYRELIDSIRESRRRMSEECNHDSARYLAYLQSFNARYSKQVELFQNRAADGLAVALTGRRRCIERVD